MKSLKAFKVILLAAGIFLSKPLFAQMDTVTIMTSSLCEQCEEAIEHNLSFEKGVKYANLDLKTNKVTVVYNSKKTDAQKIRIAITKIGYNADTLVADQQAFKKLPECCQRPDHK